MPAKYQAVVIGAGPAGLAAADVLSGHGLSVLIIDENSRPGGQLLRSAAGRQKQGGHSACRSVLRQGSRLKKRLAASGVEVVQPAQALGLFPDLSLWLQDGQSRLRTVQAEGIVCATGARERFLPFMGWTLPGVLSLGAVQIMLKGSGVLPSRKILLAGTSPLMYPLGCQVIQQGGRIQGLYDQAGLNRKSPPLSVALSHWGTFLQGGLAMVRLLSQGVRLSQRRQILEARGQGRLEEVISAQIDAHGRVIPGTKRLEQASCLALGHGFVPNLELLQQAGCSLEYARELGGWTASVDESMETSLPGLFAAGEVTGIGGGGKALLEGRLAGWSLLGRLGLVSETELGRRLARHRRIRRQERRYAAYLNRLCRVEPAAFRAIPEETVVCRCEDVTLADLRRQVEAGFTSLSALKRAGRVGMGLCQGRTCGPMVQDILQAWTGDAPEMIGRLSIRPPVKAVQLGDLAAMEHQEHEA